MTTGVLEGLLAAVNDLSRKLDHLAAGGCVRSTTPHAAETNDSRPPDWLLVPDVQDYARSGRDEVLSALAGGSLRGYQVKPGGKWRVHRDDVDSWLRGEQPAPIDASFARRKS